MRTLLSQIANLFLTLAAGVGVLCLLLLISGLIFDVKPLIFRSGSMSPTIEAGSLAIAYEVGAEELRVGDVVSVPAEKARVTHRVVEINHDGGTTTLRLRGDANKAPDEQVYQVERADRVWFSVPVVGFVIAWLSRPPGIFVLALYLAALLALIIRRTESPDTGPPSARRAHSGGRAQTTVDHGANDPFDDDRDSRAAQDHSTPPDRDDDTRRSARPLTTTFRIPGTRAVRAGLGAALLGGTAAMIATPTMAAFDDNVPVSGTAITTTTVPAPVLSCGALGVLSVRLTWTNVPGATSYTLNYGANGSQSVTQTTRNFTITAAITGGTAWVTANRNFGSTTWTSVRSNTRNYTVAAVSLCG